MIPRRPAVLTALLLLLVPAARSQEPATRPVPERVTLDHVVHHPELFMPRPLPGLQWHPEGMITWVQAGRGEAALVARSPEEKERRVLLRLKALRDAAARAGLEKVTPRTLARLTWRKDGGLRLVSGGGLYQIGLQPLVVRRLFQLPDDVAATAWAPGDRQAAYVLEHDISVVKADGSTVRVTRDGNRDLVYGGAAHRREFGIRDGMWWDAAGRRLAFYREDFSPIDPYPFVDYGTVPAKRRHGRYPMAGRSGSRVQVGVYDSRDDSVVYLETDPEADEYLTNVTWGPRGELLYVAHVNRAQDHMQVVSYRGDTGRKVRLLFEEGDPQWIEPESGPIFLPDGSGAFLWLSYADGHRHLHLHGSDGERLRQVTSGAFDVESFEGWAPDGKAFFFSSTGPDPRRMHLFHASLGGRQWPVTRGRGVHTTEVSPDGKHVLDVHTNLELPLAVDLLDIKGEHLDTVYKAPVPPAAGLLGRTRFFTVENARGQTLYGQIITPPDMQESVRHPVVHYVYGGPHVQLVKDHWLGGSSRWTLWRQYMASRGYVVFALDNRGTPGRGIEWQQELHRRLGTLELEDQLLGLDHVLELPFTDPRRVGVHGWSYGGYMTLVMMTRAGKRYRAGVAGAPVTDWRFYETGYGERYMDTPGENPGGYRAADPGLHVEGIHGRLLVVHGTADDIVVPQNTMRFVDRCVEAMVPVDYMVYPDEGHGFEGKAYEHFLRKMTRYFEDHVRNADVTEEAPAAGGGTGKPGRRRR